MGRSCTIKSVNNQVEKIEGGELICLLDPLSTPPDSTRCHHCRPRRSQDDLLEDLLSQLVLTYSDGAEWLPEGHLVGECPVPMNVSSQQALQWPMNGKKGAPWLERGRGAKAWINLLESPGLVKESKIIALWTGCSFSPLLEVAVVDGWESCGESRVGRGSKDTWWGWLTSRLLCSGQGTPAALPEAFAR